jgi:predicted 3-demethylubiquinone-9 3-methyltransferase (glyoxalase superfamily)
MSAFESYPLVTPFLWFNGNAEQAADFYCSIFPNSRRMEETRAGEKKEVLVVAFELDGQKFTALNGGPLFSFTEAISFVVRCDTQQDIDHYWDKLTADGGKESQCGWLKDKFGLSWQVVPTRIAEYACSPAAMQAMMGMKKLDLAELDRAMKS